MAHVEPNLGLVGLRFMGGVHVCYGSTAEHTQKRIWDWKVFGFLWRELDCIYIEVNISFYPRCFWNTPEPRRGFSGHVGGYVGV